MLKKIMLIALIALMALGAAACAPKIPTGALEDILDEITDEPADEPASEPAPTVDPDASEPSDEPASEPVTEPSEPVGDYSSLPVGVHEDGDDVIHVTMDTPFNQYFVYDFNGDNLVSCVITTSYDNTDAAEAYMEMLGDMDMFANPRIEGSVVYCDLSDDMLDIYKLLSRDELIDTLKESL